MKKFLIGATFLCPLFSLSQDLNWNTVSYTTGSLSANFGSIGSPASTVSMNITGNTGRIDAGFPVKYIANPPGSIDDCAVNCALRSSVTFAAVSETIVYTFSFSPSVSGLTFRLYDIDGTNASSGDQANVTASGTSGAQIITMSNLNTPASTITGSGTTSATVTGTQGNTTDHQTQVTVSGFINTLTITYANNPANPSAGNRSFSIGNMSWAGVLPVRWVSFSGKQADNGSVELNWKTADELNTDKYIIERSKDGQAYTDAGEVNAVNCSSCNYSFVDNNSGPGNTFYRIRQVDADGKQSYSNVLLIRKTDVRSSRIILSPNPANEILLITTTGNVQLKKIEFFSTTGQMVLQQKNGTNRIDISRLKPGIYQVRAENSAGEIFTESFLKN
jgi:hypothetical protein